MNGIHDMGGLHGFGRVEVEADEPVFHSEWESRVFCMTQVLDTTGIWNLDEHRHEIELMDPASYITAGYYGRWLFAMERILDRKNILKREEVEKRIAEKNADVRHFSPPEYANRQWPLEESLKIRWGAWRKEVTVTPRYSVGMKVRVRNIHPPGHTRVTAYTRGRVGIVQIVNAQAWVFPDTRAHHRGENLQAVYNVRFEAQELWGPQAEKNTFTHIDLSEDHLEPAD
jgi:nitrile hydratase